MAFSGAFTRPFRPAFDAGLAAAGNGLLNNLIAYWPLNEAAGANNALDAHSNGLTLTQWGSPGSAAGLVYSGARVTAIGKSFYSANSLLHPGNTDFTFAAWVNVTTATNNAGVFGTWENGNPDLLCYFATTDLKPSWIMSSDGNWSTPTIIKSTVALTLTVWALIVCQYDSVADIMSIQINAGTPDTISHANGSFASTGTFQLAAFVSSTSGLNFVGRIGPVAMWKSAAGGGGALSAAQRTALYNGGAGLAYSAFTT